MSCPQSAWLSTEEISGSEDGSHIFEVYSYVLIDTLDRASASVLYLLVALQLATCLSGGARTPIMRMSKLCHFILPTRSRKGWKIVAMIHQVWLFDGL
ncbi:hypothetical protein P8452_61784 [Trifolium repens]|nr:hypothetical protein P8452_61784 [Trifolium repens]